MLYPRSALMCIVASILALYVANVLPATVVQADSIQCDIPISPEGIEAGHTIITDSSCTARRHRHLPGCISHVCRVCALPHDKEQSEKIPDCYTLDAFYVVGGPDADVDTLGAAGLSFSDLEPGSSSAIDGSSMFKEPRSTVKAQDEFLIAVNVDRSSSSNSNTVISFGDSDASQQPVAPGPTAPLISSVSDERATPADDFDAVAPLVSPVSEERDHNADLSWDDSDDGEAFSELLDDDSGASLSDPLDGEVVALVEQQQGYQRHLRG